MFSPSLLRTCAARPVPMPALKTSVGVVASASVLSSRSRSEISASRLSTRCASWRRVSFAAWAGSASLARSRRGRWQSATRAIEPEASALIYSRNAYGAVTSTFCNWVCAVERGLTVELRARVSIRIDSTAPLVFLGTTGASPARTLRAAALASTASGLAATRGGVGVGEVDLPNAVAFDQQVPDEVGVVEAGALDAERGDRPTVAVQVKSYAQPRAGLGIACRRGILRACSGSPRVLVGVDADDDRLLLTGRYCCHCGAVSFTRIIAHSAVLDDRRRPGELVSDGALGTQGPIKSHPARHDHQPPPGGELPGRGRHVQRRTAHVGKRELD